MASEVSFPQQRSSSLRLLSKVLARLTGSMAKASKGGFYAGASSSFSPHLHQSERVRTVATVRAGHKPGVYASWDECSAQVKGFPAARHKKFPTRAEAEAFVRGDDRPTSAAGPPKVGTSNALQNKRAGGADGAGVPPAKRQKRAVVGEESVQVDKAVPNVFAGSSPKRRVYCDGSSRGNGKVGATAGIGVFWGHDEGAKCVSPLRPYVLWADRAVFLCRNLSERLPGKLQTNNRAEMYASRRFSRTLVAGGLQ